MATSLNQNIIAAMEQATSTAQASEVLQAEFGIDSSNNPTLWAEYMGYVPATAGGTGSDTSNDLSNTTNNQNNTSSNPLTQLSSVSQIGNAAGSIVPNGPSAAQTAAQAAQYDATKASLQVQQDQNYMAANGLNSNSVYSDVTTYDADGNEVSEQITTWGNKVATDQAAAISASNASANAQNTANTAAQTASPASQIMSGAMAVALEVGVGLQAEKTTASGGGAGNILEMGGLAAGATFAVMMFLQKLFPLIYNATPIPSAAIHAFVWKILMPVTPVQVANAQAAAVAMATSEFHHALLFGLAVTAAAVAAGVIAGEAGNKNAPTSATGNAVAAFTGAMPDWADSLPTTAVSFFTAGITLASLGFTMSPNSLYQNFPVNTVTLAADIATGTGQTGITASNVANEIYVAKGQGPNGADQVLLVSNGANGMSNVQVLNVNAQGYLIGPNGPMTSYQPFFTATLGANNAVTGVTENQAALTALEQQSGCLAIANNPNFTPAEQQAALANCASPASHNVTPTGG